MHEGTLITSLIHKIQALATDQDAKKVTAVIVRLGALAHISADHFREHFEISSAGTVAEGAELTVVTSEDVNDPRAQDILLESIDVES